MDIYSEIILDHYKHPHHKGNLENPGISIEEKNPLCGDELILQLKLNTEGKISDVGINPKGCAISCAAASMLSDKLIGKSPAEIKAMENEEIFNMLKIPISPGRVKCALLPLIATKKALQLLELRGPSHKT